MLSETEAGLASLAIAEHERQAVPAHFDAEVYNAFRRRFRLGLIGRDRLNIVVSDLATLAAERVGLRALLVEAHALADRVSVSDAFYLALARARDAELLTCDARLARGAVGLAQVRLVAAAGGSP